MNWLNRCFFIATSLAVVMPVNSALPNINISSEPSRVITSVEVASGSETSADVRMEAIDLNKDGYQDIVFSGRSASENALGLYWAENKTKTLSLTNSFQRHLISASDNLIHFNVVDLDGDGDLDIAGATRATESSGYYAPYQGNHIVWYENDGQQNFTRHLITSTEGANQLTINDYNLDGRLDIISAYGNSVKLWAQQEDKTFIATEIFSDESLELELAASAEVNGDNRPDIIIAGTRFFRALLNTEDGFVLSNIAQESFCTRSSAVPYDSCITYEATHLQVLDIDQDGDDDIGFSSDGFGSSIGWLRQNEDHSFYFHPNDYFDAELGEQINGADWKDIDGDGDIDVSIVYRDSTPSWIDNEPVLAWYENRSTVGSQPEYVRHGIVVQTDGGEEQLTRQGYDVISADFNNDGQTEIVYSYYNSIYIVEPIARVQLADGYHQFGITDSRLIKIQADDVAVISVNAEHSSIKLANLDGITIVAGAEGSNAIEFSGTEENLNRALNGLQIEPDENYFGYTELNISLQTGSDIANQTLPLWMLGVGTVLEADKHFTELKPITIDIKLTEPVSGLNINDFKVSGGALSFDEALNKSQDGFSYQGTITPLTFDDVLIQLSASKAVGNNNAENTPATLLICQPNSNQCGGFEGEIPSTEDSEMAGDPTVPDVSMTSTSRPALSISSGKLLHTTGAKTFTVNNPDLYSIPFDFDNDGDMDIVSAVFGGISDGGLQWLENKGNNQFQQPSFTQHEIMKGYNAERFVIADIDGDEDWDLMVVTERRSNGFKPNRQDATLWFENDGHMEFTRHDIEATEGGSNIKVGDLDGDQLLDIVISNRNKVTIRYQDRDENNTPIFDQRLQVLLEPAGSSSNSDRQMAVELVDINNDDNLDVVLATNITAKEGINFLYQWLNLETLVNNQQTFESSVISYRSYADWGPRTPTTLLSADINRDGFMDVLAAGGEQSDKMTLYINDQQGSFTSEHLLTNWQHEDIRITDVDQDGDLDILWSSTDTNPDTENTTAWFENLTTPNGELDLQSNTIMEGDFYTIDSADMNGDGINDWLLDNQWISGALKGQRANKLVQLGETYSGYTIKVADQDEGEILRLTLSLAKGRITLINRDHVAFEQGDGVDDAIIVIRGTVENINLALDGLIYVMDPSFKGKTDLALTLGDGLYSQQKILAINVLAVDLEISGEGIMILDESYVVSFEFSNNVTGFSSSDIQVSGANNAIASGSFNKINDARYSVQIVPKTDEDIIIQVASGAATDADQARSSASLALFCSHATCGFSTGTSDPEKYFPYAGIDVEIDQGVPPIDGGTVGETDPEENANNEEEELDNPSVETDPAAQGSGSSGGGAFWILLLIQPLLRRKFSLKA